MFGAEVACVTKSAAARGEVADFDNARNGARALMARVCSMMGVSDASDAGKPCQKLILVVLAD